MIASCHALPLNSLWHGVKTKESSCTAVSDACEKCRLWRCVGCLAAHLHVIVVLLVHACVHQQVDAAHQRYVEALTALFDAHKAKYGAKELVLVG